MFCTRQTHPRPPLTLACLSGDLDKVKQLISEGADIDHAEDSGYTCLMAACFGGTIEIVSYLVQSGADLDRQTDDGVTALKICADLKHFGCLKLLLESGAEVDFTSAKLVNLLISKNDLLEVLFRNVTRLRSYPRAVKMQALALIGAACVDQHRDLDRARGHWSMAVEKTDLVQCTREFNEMEDLDGNRSVEELDTLMKPLIISFDTQDPKAFLWGMFTVFVAIVIPMALIFYLML